MNAYVLDTSVAVAWYLEEVFSTSARAWQEGMNGQKDFFFGRSPMREHGVIH